MRVGTLLLVLLSVLGSLLVARPAEATSASYWYYFYPPSGGTRGIRAWANVLDPDYGDVFYAYGAFFDYCYDVSHASTHWGQAYRSSIGMAANSHALTASLQFWDEGGRVWHFSAQSTYGVTLPPSGANYGTTQTFRTPYTGWYHWDSWVTPTGNWNETYANTWFSNNAFYVTTFVDDFCLWRCICACE